MMEIFNSDFFTMGKIVPMGYAKRIGIVKNGILIISVGNGRDRFPIYATIAKFPQTQVIGDGSTVAILPHGYSLQVTR